MSKATGYGKGNGLQAKEWFEVPDATHHSLYDDEAQVGEAVAKLDEFFGRNLWPRLTSVLIMNNRPLGF